MSDAHDDNDDDLGPTAVVYWSEKLQAIFEGENAKYDGSNKDLCDEILNIVKGAGDSDDLEVTAKDDIAGWLSGVVVTTKEMPSNFVLGGLPLKEKDKPKRLKVGSTLELRLSVCDIFVNDKAAAEQMKQGIPVATALKVFEYHLPTSSGTNFKMCNVLVFVPQTDPLKQVIDELAGVSLKNFKFRQQFMTDQQRSLAMLCDASVPPEDQSSEASGVFEDRTFHPLPLLCAKCGDELGEGSSVMGDGHTANPKPNTTSPESTSYTFAGQRAFAMSVDQAAPAEEGEDSGGASAVSVQDANVSARRSRNSSDEVGRDAASNVEGEEEGGGHVQRGDPSSISDVI